MIQITFNCDTPADAVAILAKLNAGSIPAPLAEIAPSPLDGPDAAAGTAKDTKPRTRRSKPADDVPQITHSEPAPAPAADRYLTEIRPLVVEASEKAGTPKVVALLASFGVKRGQDVPVDKLDEFEAGLRELLQSPEESVL